MTKWSEWKKGGCSMSLCSLLFAALPHETRLFNILHPLLTAKLKSGVYVVIHFQSLFTIGPSQLSDLVYDQRLKIPHGTSKAKGI